MVDGGTLAVMDEGPWTITGAVAAFISALMVIIFGVYEFVWRPWRHHRILKHPGKAWFHVPAISQRQILYAEQNHDAHLVEELTLAVNSTVAIGFLFRPSVSFEVYEVYFGCDLPKGSQPIIQSYLNLFIDRGVTEESPETHPDTNYTDNHNLHHIKKRRVFARGECYSHGCEIETRGPRIFEFKLFFVGDVQGTSENKLIIRVEQSPATRMRCHSHEHRWKGCFIQPTVTNI